MLGKKQSPIPKKNPELDSALRSACVHDAPGLIGFLLDMGADLHAVDANGLTPLHIAAGANKGRACAALLSRGASAKAQTPAGLSPLHIAAVMDGFFAVPELSGCGVEMRDGESRAAAHLAAEHNSALALVALRKCGADFSARDSAGRTPLHRAALSGSADAARELGRDAEKAARDSEGRTPLHCAAFSGRGEAAAILLSSGSDASARDAQGETALHLALRGGHFSAASALARFGADVLLKNAAGESCLELALEFGGAEALAAGEEARGLEEADASADGEESFRRACEVLGCKPEDDARAKKAAYRRACMRTHPDRAGGDAEAFKQVQAAWKTLQLRDGRDGWDGREA